MDPKGVLQALKVYSPFAHCILSRSHAFNAPFRGLRMGLILPTSCIISQPMAAMSSIALTVNCVRAWPVWVGRLLCLNLGRHHEHSVPQIPASF